MIATPIEISYRGHRLQLECAQLDAANAAAPLMVFLHEGLGSLAMWRDFPARLCAAARCRGLVYSRPGYGRSTAMPDGGWGPDYLAREARDVLPAVLAAAGIDAETPVHLFGHSDGGSIALMHAAQPSVSLAGIVVMAPHIVVEPISLSGIARACAAYEKTDLRARLARFHDDVDAVFRGWSGAWLDPRFAGFSIETLLPGIRCPVLAIQGDGDEYGTMAQIDGIRARVPDTELLKLQACGHSPHRDQPEAVIAATVAWLARTQSSIRS